MMKTHLQTRLGPLLALCTLGAGCATDDERMANAEFGNSVRDMIALQTAHAGSAGTGIDGQKAQAVLRAYRQDVAKPKEAEREILLRVGD